MKRNSPRGAPDNPRRHAFVLSAVLALWALALWLVGCSPQPVSSQAATGPVIGEGVLAQLEATGEARVIIQLEDTAAAQATDAERQDAVLQALPPDAFQLMRRYDNIPALAGTLTADGLAILKTLPQVTSIQADEPGGATGA
jgi:hypothetical protein